MQKGLTLEEVKQRQAQFGKNELTPSKKDGFLKKAFHIISEPMFLLLIIAAVIYLILGELIDGIMMLVFISAIIVIEIVQEWRTDKTLERIKDLSAPKIKVIRDGTEQQIASSELVPGDIMLISEGVKIPADGVIIKCNDLCIDESSLTGEAEGVWKTSDNTKSDDYWRRDYCYAGTLVTQGSAIVQVERIGLQTEYGKIGKAVTQSQPQRSPLQKQIGSLVKVCGLLAIIFFVVIVTVTYFNMSGYSTRDRITESILTGLALAMGLIPEEFPVILTIFLAMGAWRLARKNSLVRNTSAIETLGAVSVLCVDKTGTITMNQMTVQDSWEVDSSLARIMGLACETDAYDPMEKAMLKYCESKDLDKTKLFSGELITEYPFTNELKMMGHVWKCNNEIIIAAKGSPEQVLTLCKLSEKELKKVEEQIQKMSEQGLRTIAVAQCRVKNEKSIPKTITDCSLTFCGLVGLADPPRDSVYASISTCKKAGIRVVMITGDNGVTASSIAKKIGMSNCDNIITGKMLDEMTDEQLREAVKVTNIFSRVIPEHKMRIVKAFKDNGEIVAMTGDGVNDAPALKYADIGIAMGKRGSEVSREAADIILMDDDFTTIVDTVKDGRRIYDNIRKAVGYVLTLHVPILLSAFLAPLIGIEPAMLMLLPLHIVLMELVTDPTCSIVLERQPAETGIMNRMPRKPNESLLNKETLLKSICQGLATFAAGFITYYIVLKSSNDAVVARTMGFSILVLANLFLVQVNSSDIDSMFSCAKKLFKDKIIWIINAAIIIGLLLIIYSPLNSYFKFGSISALQFLLVLGLAMASVFWYEIVKFIKRCKIKKRNNS